MSTKMKKIINLFFIVCLALGSWSCSEEALDPVSRIVDSQTAQNEFDKWLVTNYVTPYNIEYKYRMEDIEIDMNNYVVPADFKKARQMAHLLLFLGIQPYDELTGSKDFIRTYFPKLIHLIGSAAYRNNGTMLLGTAEGGVKITLFYINALSFDPDFLNEYYFHTIHHEFVHILNQTKPYSPDFDMISGTEYTADAWNDIYNEATGGAELALQDGFITPYASNEPREDFAELVSTYITTSAADWAGLMTTAGATGSGIISSKMDIVREYMLSAWSIDIDDLRSILLEREGQIGTLGLANV
jgi:substrate import-associated zinc metallohydrolase lipoprotein